MKYKHISRKVKACFRNKYIFLVNLKFLIYLSIIILIIYVFNIELKVIFIVIYIIQGEWSIANSSFNC